MEQACVDCGETPYELADGRFKCGRCHRRWSWTSAWDSSRIAESAKQRLLERFADGRPAYGDRNGDACTATKERFFRLVRAAVTHHARRTSPILATSATGRGADLSDHVPVRFELRPEKERRAPGPRRGAFARQLTPPLGAAEADMIWVRLPMEGSQVRMRGYRGDRLPRSPSLVRFWAFATEQLALRPQSHLKFLPIHLGEICFRFTYRQQDLYPVLSAILRNTSVQELRSLLEEGSAPGQRSRARPAGSLQAIPPG